MNLQTHKTQKKTKRLRFLALASALVLAACQPGNIPGNTLGVPSNAGNEESQITGSIVADGAALNNATLVLIQNVNGQSQDVGIVRSDDNGSYSFDQVGAGENYRLAYVLQSEAERRQDTVKYYEPQKDARTANFFSFITTDNFTYLGQSEQVFQVPQMDVAWRSNLSPHDTSVPASQPIRFNWSPVDGATSYGVDIRDSSNNPFYKSGELATTQFDWTTLKGNQGDNNGVAVKANETYFYLITASLNRPIDDDGPTVTYGGTALAKFTTR